MSVRAGHDQEFEHGSSSTGAANRFTTGDSTLQPALNWFAFLLATLLIFLSSGPAVFAQDTLSTVSTGAASRGIAVNPTQDIIYVSQGDNTLTYIDGATNTVHKIADPAAATTNGAGAIVTYLNGVFVANSISNDIVTYYVTPGGGYQFQQLIKDPHALQPVAMASNPNGFGSLYVVNKGSNSVSVFVNSGTGLAFSKAIAVGTSPTAIAENVATNTYYVTNSGSGNVSVIDGGTGTVIATVDVSGSPSFLAVNTATNKTYVGGPTSNSITVIDGSNNTNSINGVANNPAALAINPLTNQIYVATLDGKIYIINGSTDTISNSVTAQVGSAPVGQAAIVVDATTNIAFATIQGGNVTTVDGGTFATTNPPVGPGGNAAMALNPVTHRVYVDSGSNGISVLDGSSNAFTTLSPAQNLPWSLAVNPATNKIYVANSGANSVTVINGATNTVVDTVTTGVNPRAITVDPVKNLIFTANFGDATATIIDGSNDHAVSQPITITNPDSIAVDPILAKVHGASSGQNSGFNFASSASSGGFSSGSFSNVGPIAVLSNPAAGMAYTLFTDKNIEVDDEAAPHSFIIGVCGSTNSTPTAMDFNPVTNTIYISCGGNEVTVLQNASGFYGGNQQSVHDSSAISPVAVAVNSVTNQIYVANAGDGSGNGSVTVIDGATNTITNLPIGGTPVAIAVNVASGKVYVQLKSSGTSGALYVIDPSGQFFLGGTISEGSIASLNTQLAVNVINNTVYALDRFSNTVSTLAEKTPEASGPTTAIQAFTNNTWSASTTPTFNFTATNSIDGSGPYVVYYQVDSRLGPWNYAGGSGVAGSFSGTLSQPLAPGFHVVFAYSANGTETSPFASDGGSGFSYNPFVGAVAAYGFLVAPPNAGTPFYPASFGTQAIGGQTAAQQPLLSNHGGAPLNFTYSITGPNAADFIEVPYTGSDKRCNSLAGALPSGTFCDVNIAFHPSIIGAETATLTFTDNSLGVAGATQTVQLTGVGAAPPNAQLTVNWGGSGVGIVTDGGSLNCSSPSACGQSYPIGTTVTMTATPLAGSLFTGWSGACSGTGPCVLTLASSQSVTANFYIASAATCAAGDTKWIGGATGNWSTAASWSTGVVPTGGVNVCINNNHSPAASVTLDVAASIGNLTINPGNSLTIASNQALTVSGTIANSGRITLSTLNGSNVFLTFNGAVTLTGGGTVLLNQATGNGQPILNNVNNGSLTNVNNTIQGSGQIGNNGLLVTNLAGGVINANTALPLALNNGTITNQGTIETTAGGQLQVSVTVANKTGTLLSTGAGSSLQFYNGTKIQGGTLKTTAGGFLGVAISNGATLDGATLGPLTISGLYTTSYNATTVVNGTINNSGTIQLSTVAGYNSVLTFNGAVTLTGGGTVLMSQATGNGQPILNNQNSGSLINVNNTIQGAGQIGNNGLLVTNQAGGVINANIGFPIQFNNGTITNQGLIDATAGGQMQISVVMVNQGATILSSGTGSAIQLQNGTTIRGGTISSTGGGFLGVPVSNVATLDGGTLGQLTISGLYTTSYNGTTVVNGTINNTGTIQLSTVSGFNSFLTFNGAVTLTGGGTVLMSQATGNGQPILNNQNNGSLINVNNTIQGAGQIGNNGLLVTNQAGGVINANIGFPIQFNNGTITNQGLIEATAGGVLQVSVTVINKGTTILSSGTGSAVQLDNGTTIQGGTISSTGGGFLGVPVSNGVTLDGTTQGPLTISGLYTASYNSTTVVNGTINNTGTIQLSTAAGYNSFLTSSGAVTLTGGGTVLMSQATGNGQPILNNVNNGSLNNVNNTIQGSGQLGNNGLIVVNSPAGVISANGPFQLQMGNAIFTNQGSLVANGSLTPGTLPTLNYTQAASGSFEMALGGLTAGTQYSQLQNGGTATLAGALNIAFLNGFRPAAGSQFTVLTSGAITGQFATINSPALGGGLSWHVSYNPLSVVLSVVAGAGGGSSTLTITDLGTGTGTVTDDLGLINCTTTGGVISGTCSASYQTGSVVVLTAAPAAGTTFSGWNACSGTSTCTVTMNTNQAVSANFGTTGGGVPLSVSLIGTGNGTVTDNFQQINCVNTAGVQTGSCAASYAAGTIVTLTATPSAPSTFAGWGSACSGTGGCTVTMTAAQTVTASFAPPPQLITLSFAPGTNVTGMATYDCPSNPSPTPANPCTDPNAHAAAVTIPQVLQPFSLTVQASEVPPSTADGVCPNGATPSTDFDCRFVSFFTYQTLGNGNKIVPLCYPFANGNCVHYLVYSGTPGVEPNPSFYVGPIDWAVSWNNDHFIPPAPYTGSTPHLYDDPDYAVNATSPFGTNCNTPMQVGNPPVNTSPAIFCQFEFDITTGYDPNKKVDARITGRTKQFNDVVVAFPPANVGTLTVTSTPSSLTVTPGTPLNLTITVANSAGGAVAGATLGDALPAGTNVSWSISPAYTGPGTCTITGAVGAQVLNCSFGTIAASQTFNISLFSANSSLGTYTNTAIIKIGNQQLLTIAALSVQTLPTAFSNLTASQSIYVGTASVTLSGTIGSGAAFPAAGETVSITIHGATQTTTIGASGTFTASFPTATIPASTTPNTITYSYAGDATFSAATDTSTTLTVKKTGDVNGDGVVNCADIAIVKASFGKKRGQAGFDARADINNDGIVNVIDLATVARQLPAGSTCP